MNSGYVSDEGDETEDDFPQPMCLKHDQPREGCAECEAEQAGGDAEAPSGPEPHRFRPRSFTDYLSCGDCEHHRDHSIHNTGRDTGAPEALDTLLRWAQAELKAWGERSADRYWQTMRFVTEVERLRAERSAPPQTVAVPRCADCGVALNRGEAQCFTVCDTCWEKAYPRNVGAERPTPPAMPSATTRMYWKPEQLGAERSAPTPDPTPALQALYDAVVGSHQPFFWDKTIKTALEQAQAGLGLGAASAAASSPLPSEEDKNED